MIIFSKLLSDGYLFYRFSSELCHVEPIKKRREHRRNTYEFQLVLGSIFEPKTTKKKSSLTVMHYEPGQDYDDGKRQDA